MFTKSDFSESIQEFLESRNFGGAGYDRKVEVGTSFVVPTINRDNVVGRTATTILSAKEYEKECTDHPTRAHRMTTSNGGATWSSSNPYVALLSSASNMELSLSNFCGFTAAEKFGKQTFDITEDMKKTYGVKEILRISGNGLQVLDELQKLSGKKLVCIGQGQYTTRSGNVIKFNVWAV